MSNTDGPDLRDLPEPVLEGRRALLPNLVWVIPLVAALVGLGLVVQMLLAQGPTITISFSTAEGLEPGKTKVKFREVDIGDLRSLRVAEDRTRVVATVELTKEAERFAVADSRFWVVRPRLAGGAISGLSTLVSGSYIGVDGGKSEDPAREFVGLDEAPVVPADVPGTSYQLQAADLGSLDIGSPIFHRRVQVGQVTSFSLAPDGSGVTLRVFVKAPYDKLVTASSRFWHASGVDVRLDASGVKVGTQSLAAVLLGGIAFRTPEEHTGAAQAPARSRFNLAADEAEAMKAPDGEPVTVVLRFNQSIRGLAPGAPVDFRGVVLGSVRAVSLEMDPRSKTFVAPVVVELYPERLSLPSPASGESAERQRAARLAELVRQGLRAQLRTGNLLTGQLYVALDFFPKAPAVRFEAGRSPLELPTVAGDLEELQQKLGDIVRKLDKLPLEAIAGDLRRSLGALEATLRRTESLMAQADQELLPEAKETLAGVRRSMAGVDSLLAQDGPLQQDARQAMRELENAARSLRALTDVLERQPEALLKGKAGE